MGASRFASTEWRGLKGAAELVSVLLHDRPD
jgi:hypothetical protein